MNYLHFLLPVKQKSHANSKKRWKIERDGNDFAFVIANQKRSSKVVQRF